MFVDDENETADNPQMDVDFSFDKRIEFSTAPPFF
jgi:hypothetical protein